MKFKADENLPVEVAEDLREAGYEAVIIASLPSESLESIFGSCRKDRFAFVVKLAGRESSFVFQRSCRSAAP